MKPWKWFLVVSVLKRPDAIRQQATDGTNTMKLDFCGVCVEPPKLITELDGVVSVELNMVPQWNSVYDSCWGAEVTIA